MALPPRVAVWASSPVGQVSIEEGLTTNSWRGLTTLEGDTYTIGTAKTGSSQWAFERLFLADGGVVGSALETRLRCLSLKLTLKF